MKVLLIRYKYLGDVVMLLPVAEAIKETYPESTIDILTSESYSELFLNCPWHGKTWAIRDDIRGWSSLALSLFRSHYDVVADLHSSYQSLKRSSLVMITGAPIRLGYKHRFHSVFFTQVQPLRTHTRHYVEDYMALFSSLGIVKPSRGRIYISVEEQEWAEEYLHNARLDRRRTVCLVPGARLPYKRWPASRFAEVGDRLLAQGYQILVIGHSYDTHQVETVCSMLRSAPALTTSSLRKISSIFSVTRVAVCNDSGLKHLAAASGSNVVAIHGHSDPLVWGPWGEGHEIVTAGVRCQPCNNLNTCPRGTVDCLNGIHAEEVVKSVERVLSGCTDKG